MSEIKYEEINQTVRYTNWTAFRRLSPVANEALATLELNSLVESLKLQGLVLRGAYDLRGLRGDADLLLWLHAPEAETIQKALRLFLKTELGKHFETTWSGMGLHRPAEFNRSHVPGFMTGAGAKDWLCIYPFVRSYEWYLLPEAERREMLIEHGQAGHKYPGIVSNTVASFALGDYEWLLALESDELHEIVDMMRELRYTRDRLHVREEVPFFTGKQLDQTQIGEMYS
jgi:hydrogen peroxide-dependent heme synthase